MAVESTYTAYPSPEEHMPGSGEADNSQMESWMADVLNQDLLSSHPINWDGVLDPSFDSDLAQPSSAQYHTESLPNFSNVYDHSNSFSENSLIGTDNIDLVNQFSNSNSLDFEPTLHPSATTFPENLGHIQNEDDMFGSLTNTFQTSIPQPEDNSHQVFDQVASAFKDLARARAAADPRRISKKQKQRDATIALYLERLRDTCNEAVAMLASDGDEYDTPPTNTQSHTFNTFSQRSSTGGSSFSSPYDTNLPSGSDSPESIPEFLSYTQDQSLSPPTASSTQPQVNGGVELIMDLNMNTATSLPRKHRPRTQAQRQRYLAVRNQGACEKHKRQHKRCTCIDKVLTTTAVQSNSTVKSRAGVDRFSIPMASSHVESSITTDRPLQIGSHKSAVKLCPGGLAPTLNSGSELQQSANINLSGQSQTRPVHQSSDMVSVPRLHVSDSKGCQPSSNLEMSRWKPKSIRDQHDMVASGERDSCNSTSNHSQACSSVDSAYASLGVHSGTFTRAHQTPVSGLRLQSTAPNNDPVPSCDMPLDSRALRHSAVSTEARFGSYLSSQQQRQQCNHTNSTYGMAAQPCDAYAVYAPSSLLLITIGRPEHSPGFRLMTLAYNWVRNRVKLRGQQHSFTLWCFAWISLLAMTSICRGVFG